MTSPFRHPNLHRACWALSALLLMPGLCLGDITKGSDDKKKRKKNKDEPEFLPEAKSATVRFIAGTSVEIELAAATALISPVRFVIREMPQHGSLSEIRMHPRELNRAYVTYTHGDKSASLGDRFTFAVKLDESSWSAPGVVTLLGKRADPKIEVLGSPTFSRTLPGAASYGKLVLKNSGIAPFAADIQWQPPWTGPPRIELGIGQHQEFQLMVKPAVPGTLIWEREIQPGVESSKVRLYVECMDLFVVAPGHLKLKFDGEKGDRRGRVGIANATDEPMTLAVEPPDKIESPAEITVPPKQTASFEISLPADDVGAYHGELWVIREPYRERVVIDAAPEPAQAVLVEPQAGALDLGSVSKGKTARSQVVLKNVGGEPAVLAVQAGSPFRVAEADSALSLAPGEEKTVPVEAMSAGPGQFSGAFVFNGPGTRLTVQAKLAVTDPEVPQAIKPKAPALAAAVKAAQNLRAPVAKAANAIVDPVTLPDRPAASRPRPDAPPAAAAAKIASPDSPPSAISNEPSPGSEGSSGLVPLNNTQSAVFAYMSEFGFPIPPILRSSTLSKVESIIVKEQGRDSLVVGWKETEPKPEKYLLEEGYKVLNKPTGRMLTGWRPFPNQERITGEPGEVTIRLNNLVPESRYKMRVLGIDQQGKVSEPSDIHYISTASPFRLPAWTWQALIGVALVIFVFVFWMLKSGRWQV